MTDNNSEQMPERIYPSQEAVDKHHRRNPLVQYLLAAAAIALVLVAAGFLLLDRLPWGTNKPGLPIGSGSGQLVLESGSVRSVADYQELYDIISKSREGSYADGRAYATEDIVASQGEGGSSEAAAVAPLAADSSTSSSGASTFAGSGYSQTNVQVAGVDEGDIVKTDGQYIYVLSNNGQYELAIFSADGEQTTELSRVMLTAAALTDATLEAEAPVTDATPATDVALADNPSAEEQYNEDRYLGSWNNISINELYISGSTLLAIGSENYMPQTDDSTYPEYSNQSFVLCYDVSDPTAPVMMAEFTQSGYFHSSRLSGSILYLISNYYPRSNISPDNPGGYVPLIGKDGSSSTIEAKDVSVMPGIDYPSYTVLSSIDLDSLQRLDQQSILGQATTIYMSADNLYIGSTQHRDEVVDSYQDSVYTIEKHVGSNSTQLMRVGLSGGMLDAAAQCTIDGYLLNQFSLDEYQGNLRLVLTVDRFSYQVLRDDSHGVENYQYDDPTPTTNALYVLSPGMTVLGSIDGLAADERIYSARFDGAVGYMVTFRQVDPLFAIDLSDPSNPKVTSELKIPGFSTYLHPFGPGKLLGLGYDTVDGRTIGIKLSMFDVSDPFDVRELHVTQVAGVSGYSEALYNHKAVLVDVEKNIIGIPLNDYQNEQTSQEYLVYQFTEGEGFGIKGRLELSTVENGYYYGGGGIRGMYIGDYLYVCSGAYLDVFELGSLIQVKSLQVSNYSNYGNVPIPIEPMPMPQPRLATVE